MVKYYNVKFDKKTYNKIWRKNNPERCRENERKYRERNRDAIRVRSREYSKQYRERNYDRVRKSSRDYMKTYRIQNAELVKKQKRIYYKKNKDSVLEKMRLYYRKNKVARLAYANVYRECNRELINKKEKAKSTRKVRYNYIRLLKLRYGLTLEEYTQLSCAQNNQCKICGRHVSRLCVDHKEKGSYRGLLCSTCNVGLGMFRDSITYLQSAIKYLKAYQGKQLKSPKNARSSATI